MQQQYPNAEIITDVASGLNYRRKGDVIIAVRIRASGSTPATVMFKARTTTRTKATTPRMPRRKWHPGRATNHVSRNLQEVQGMTKAYLMETRAVDGYRPSR